MLLIEEYIRLILEEEDQEEYVEIEDNEKKYTYKELYDFLRFVNSGKNAKKAINFVASATAGAALEGIVDLSKYASGNITKALASITEESASNILDSFLRKLDLPKGNPLKALARFYGVNDEVGLKGIAIPNNVSNLIDDKVEEAFIKSLLKELKVKAEQSPNETVDSEFVMNKLKAYTKDDNEKTRGSFASIR